MIKRPGAPDSTVGNPDDPTGLIRQVLEMGAEFNGYPEDILLSWVLSLPREIDAGAAAARLLDAYDLAEGPVPAGPIGRVWQLLRETARHHPALQRATARRGGRAGRRGGTH